MLEKDIDQKVLMLLVGYPLEEGEAGGISKQGIQKLLQLIVIELSDEFLDCGAQMGSFQPFYQSLSHLSEHQAQRFSPYLLSKALSLGLGLAYLSFFLFIRQEEIHYCQFIIITFKPGSFCQIFISHKCALSCSTPFLNQAFNYNNITMSKQLSAAGNESALEQADKTNVDNYKGTTLNGFHLLSFMVINQDPFDKLLASDQLSYLPNLYLRQYKAIDELVRLRQDFPEQRILLERPTTKWDILLNQVKLRATVIKEERKFKIVQRIQVAKSIKMEVQRNQLRSQENYHFHRLTSSYLADAVANTFQQQAQKMEEQPKKEMKQQEIKSNIIKKNQDDIFVDGENEYYYVPEQNNLLDDLLNDPIAEKKEEFVERQDIFIQPVSTYVSSTAQDNGLEARVAISRKTSLRRLNQNVRRRLKIKEEEEEQAGRSLSSATVFLSNLLNTQPEQKNDVLVELSSRTEWLFSSQRNRKRKDDDSFELRWPPEQLQKFQKRNDRTSIRKGKIDNNLLIMTMPNDQEEYRKMFEKNIASSKSFPPTLRNIPSLSTPAPKRYYNQFHDPQYENFIRKYNKKAIFNKFSAKAQYLFPQNYSHDQIEQSQSINAGKIFVHPPEKVLDRIIYKISDYKLGVSVKTQFSHIKLDLNQMVALTFLAKRYICKFGNDWKSITQFIAMSPLFSNHHLSQQTVQQVYQIVSKYQENDPLSEINLWDKKVLPFEYYGCQSYTEFNSKLFQKSTDKIFANKIEIEKSETDDDQPTFDFSRYSQMVKQKPEEPQLNQLFDLQSQYEEYARPIFTKIIKSDHNFLIKRPNRFQKVRKILEKFEESQEYIRFVPQERQKKQSVSKILDEVQNATKVGEIKPVYPFRKKKNINERNNELVKILQALRNKNVSPAPGMQPKKPDDQTKAFPPVKPSTAPAAPPQPQPIKAGEDKKQPVTKQPETVVPPTTKKLGAPAKKDRKPKDGDDKK